MKKINAWKLIISIALPFLAAAIGSVFTSSSVSTWYVELNKPVFNPPDWVFGPVWTLLYLMMGIAFYIVWTSRSKHQKFAFIAFGTQLFLNALWSILFFGLKMPLLAFIEIILLWIAIAATMFYFYKIKRSAAYLLVPYILWVSFAAVLNVSLAILN
jgi:tryptophan-rich sensory protein